SGFGVQIYPNAQNTLIKQNVIFRTGNGGVIFGGEGLVVSNGNVVTRNIVSDSEGSGIRGYWNGAVGSDNVAVNNCVWETAASPIGDQGGFVASATVVANPRFVDPGRHDFRLAKGSPCLRVTCYDIAAAVSR